MPRFVRTPFIPPITPYHVAHLGKGVQTHAVTNRHSLCGITVRRGHIPVSGAITCLRCRLYLEQNPTRYVLVKKDSD